MLLGLYFCFRKSKKRRTINAMYFATCQTKGVSA